MTAPTIKIAVLIYEAERRGLPLAAQDATKALKEIERELDALRRENAALKELIKKGQIS